MATSDNEEENQYDVTLWTDEQLLAKERSKRRRKTGDMVGTGLSAVAAIAEPALWGIAGASVKNYLNSSSKHKSIVKEMNRRGLQPLKEDMSDTVVPILSGAGGMVVGRALGPAAGAGAGAMAGNLINSIGSRAFGGNSSSSKKDKKASKVFPGYNSGADVLQSRQQQQRQPQSAQSMVMVPASTASAQHLMTPSAYAVPENQPVPATLVYHYYPPTEQFPRGYYAQIPVQPAAQPMAQQYLAQPTPVSQQAPLNYQQAPLNYQQAQPAPVYQQHSAPQVQYYGGTPQQHVQMPQPGLHRSQTTYEAPPMYHAPPRPQTFSY